MRTLQLRWISRLEEINTNNSDLEVEYKSAGFFKLARLLFHAGDVYRHIFERGGYSPVSNVKLIRGRGTSGVICPRSSDRVSLNNDVFKISSPIKNDISASSATFPNKI